MPTIESLKVAVTTFERQGGTANIIVCDDGLQVLPSAERSRRMAYYKQNNLAFVARPAHGIDGFERRGRFKKAGNLNYCNILSLEIEQTIEDLRSDAMVSADKGFLTWSEKEETHLYQTVLDKKLLERGGKTWADGNIRM
jgi:hypothetical protein